MTGSEVQLLHRPPLYIWCGVNNDEVNDSNEFESRGGSGEQLFPLRGDLTSRNEEDQRAEALWGRALALTFESIYAHFLVIS
jgi:hypothetical protein